MTDTITTDETRRLIKRLRGRVFLTATVAADLLRLCDGLDIAEKAMQAAAVLKELRKPRPRALRVHTWLHWHHTAIDVQVEALAEWDKWEGS